MRSISTPLSPAPVPSPSYLSPSQPSTTAPGRPTLISRSSSAPSPYLTPSLQAHDFPVLPLQSSTLNGRHVGEGAFKRLFIGPHVLVSAQEGVDGGVAGEAGRDAEGRAGRRKKGVGGKVRRPGGRRMMSGESMGGPRSKSGTSVMRKWTGGSFEIGGDVREAVKRREELLKRRVESIKALSASLGPTKKAAGTFVTAATHIAPTTTLAMDYTPNEPTKAVEEAYPALVQALLRRPSDIPFSDSTSLSAAATTLPVAPMAPALKSSLRPPTLGIGKGHPRFQGTQGYSSGRPIAKSVQLPRAGVATIITNEPLDGDAPPPDVQDVLSRPADLAGVLDDSDSAKTVFTPFEMPDREKGSVRMQERMLVKYESTPRGDLPDAFNEHTALKYTTQSSPWEEFAVIYRSSPPHLELYSEYKISATSFFLGSKKLVHTIPLTTTTTKLSLYSSPDSIFALTSRLPNRGTSIFIIRPRTISIAKEWYWTIWRELGGKVPEVLDISVPGLGVKIRMPIPLDLPPSFAGKGYEVPKEGEGYKVLRHEKVVRVCMDQLGEVEDWKVLLRGVKEEGCEMRLAWRRGERLDWVERGEEEKDWSVMMGFALTQPGLETTLELRPALHYPTTVLLPSARNLPTTRLSEPPSIEGYLTRVVKKGRPERVYLTSHDSHLFLCRTSGAFPPTPPTPIQEVINNPASASLAPFIFGGNGLGGKKKEKKRGMWERMGLGGRKKEEKQVGEGEEDIEGELRAVGGVLEALEEGEKGRALRQIEKAMGYVDLGDIVKVESMKLVGEWVDVEDEGGEEGLEGVEDKVGMRRRRSFVMSMSNGVEVTFECYSISLALEWIGRITALSTYWRRRSRVDAIDQMEHSPTLLSRSRSHPHSSDPALDSSSPLLAKIFHFCILESCRTIISSGRFYLKRGLRGTFVERYVFLLPGVLLEYNTRSRNNLHGKGTNVVYHRRVGHLSLENCYVFSGALSQGMLGGGSGERWDPAEGGVRKARIYTATDGLRTVDEDVNCTVCIWKKGGDKMGLGKKGSVTVFRTRSKIERDQWLFALNTAIEKLHRGNKDREETLKSFPWLDRREPQKK